MKQILNDKHEVKWSENCSVVSYSLQPHGMEPARFLCPWDSPGKSTGVGCHCLFISSLIPERILHLGGLSPCSTLGGGGEMNTRSLWDMHDRRLPCAPKDRALGWGFCSYNHLFQSLRQACKDITAIGPICR